MQPFYYGLNVYIPLKFNFETNPQCDGLWKWDLWEVIRVRLGHENSCSRINTLTKREQEIRFSLYLYFSLSPCTHQGKTMLGHNQDEGLNQQSKLANT